MNSSRNSLIDDTKFAAELSAYITDAGQHVTAQDIQDFMAKPEVVKRYHITKPISLDTACRWMSKLNFRWGKPPTGMYIDSHECPDVVRYRQDIYLPTLAQCEQRMRAWDEDNLTYIINPSSPSPTCHTVLWFHDQSIFYQNDWWKF